MARQPKPSKTPASTPKGARAKPQSSASGAKRGGSPPGRPSMLRRLITWSLALGVIAALAAACAMAGVFYYYGQDLPKLLKREDFKPAQLTRIYAAGGELIGEFSLPDKGGRRTVIPMEEIPLHVRYAFMAAEDADFMTHSGIDYLGMVRAFYYAAFHDTGLKGTSTITQQVVKNLILTPERSARRKIQEIILAMELEKNLTKEDILWLYLNELYMGHGVNGVEEAAQLYFGKPARELTLEEGAVLAGITQSPERHSPIRNPQSATKRRAFVLKQLWEKGFIPEAEYRAALDVPLKLAPRKSLKPHLGSAPHFVEHVRKALIQRYGQDKVYMGGLRVYTTLDLKAQRAAELAARDGLRAYDLRQGYYRPRRKLKPADLDAFLAKQAKALPASKLQRDEVYEAAVTQVKDGQVWVQLGAVTATLSLEPRSRILGEADQEKRPEEVFERGQLLRVMLAPSASDGDASQAVVRFEPGPEVGAVMLDPRSRDVVALVGSYDFAFNQFDHVTQANRQTGSTFKPFVYAAALEAKEITAATVIHDQPEVFKLEGAKTYSPRNSDGQFRGPIRIREAIGSSRNVVSVHVLMRKLGLERAEAFARKVGISSPLTKNATLVMGSSSLRVLEIVNAYATFASGGELSEPHFIQRVETMRGEREVWERTRAQVLAPEVAYLITDLLLAVTQGFTDTQGKRQSGTAPKLGKLPFPVAGKTGTTNDAIDAWFIGYSPAYVAGVWVGFADNKPLGAKEYGGKVAAPIWHDMMLAAHKGKTGLRFEPPKLGITTAVIDPATGLLARQGGIEETFLVGTAPTEYAPEVDQDVSSFLLNQVQ